MKEAAAVLAELRARGLGDLVDEVCAARHLLPLEVCGRSRVVAVVAGRHEIWRAMRAELKWTFTMIGDVFGVHHKAVMHAWAKEEVP